LSDLEQTVLEHKWHALNVDEVAQTLQTTLQGLSEEEAKSRLETFGLNELREEKRTTPLGVFLNQFKSILIIILILSAGVSGYIALYVHHEPPIDMYVIVLIVIMNAISKWIRFERGETIANGDSCCNFQIYRR